MTWLQIEQAEPNGHTDGRVVMLKNADEEAQGIFDPDDVEPGWVLVRGIDDCELMCPQPTHYRLS